MAMVRPSAYSVALRLQRVIIETSPVSGQPLAVSPGTAALAQALGTMCTVHPRVAGGMLPCAENGAQNGAQNGRFGRLWNAALSATLRRLAEEL